MILKNCRLVPQLSDHWSNELADVLVENGRIKAIVPTGEAPADAEEINCEGKTVIPGLLDLHVHLVCEREPNDVWHAFDRYYEVAPQLANFLDYGVTTVRDCGSTMSLACRLREGVEHGFFEGPRILSSGHIISPEAMRNNAEGGIHIIANGPTEMMKAGRKEIADGADFIKIYATQSMSQVRGQDPKCIMTSEEIKELVSVAEQNNTYVAAHAHSTDAINTCIRCGVRSIEHATYMDDESIRLLLETPNAYVVLTHACGEPYHGDDGYNDPAFTKEWNTTYAIESKKRCRALENKAYKAGVKIGVGTDLLPHEAVKYPYELQIRKESCGMSDIDILLQATKMSAEIAMIADQVGEVKEGLYADLLVVDGKPDEDISVLYHKPSMVIQNGRLIRKDGKRIEKGRSV